MATEVVCGYCAKPGKLHRDHVVPRSRGGPDNANNIVMACQSCNSSKGSQLPSEWMGDRCPKPILLIEARMNAKLKTIYKSRDKKKIETPMFAMSFGPTGSLQYVGEVVSETTELVRINPANAFLMYAVLWDLTGEVVTVPTKDCRLFLDLEECLDAVELENRREDRQAKSYEWSGIPHDTI